MPRKFVPEPIHDIDDLVENNAAQYRTKPLKEVREGLDALTDAIDALFDKDRTLRLPPDSTARAALVAAAFCAPEVVEDDEAEDLPVTPVEADLEPDDMSRELRGLPIDDDELPFDATADEDVLP